jgi:hypothetical protein
MTFEIANYNDHRQAMTALLQQSCSRPVLFIKGEKNYGKTWLLRWFRAELGGRCHLLKFNLADPEQLLSPALILHKCSEQLGESHFPNFQREALVYNRSRVAVIRDVEVKGNNNTVTADVGGTPEEQLLVAKELTKIFVADLKDMPAPDLPIIFAFDHVESTKLVISRWLLDGLIPELRSVPHSRVVLAAPDFPSLDEVPWEPSSTTITLTGINDVAAWLSLVGILKKRLPPEAGANPQVYLQGAIQLSKGVPGTLMPFIQAFPEI